MKCLLDTHTFIWWDSKPDHLSDQVLQLLHEPSNAILLSVVSAWEMQIKSQLGKLQLQLPLAEIIAVQQQTNRMVILPVELEHVLTLDTLALHHRDPFDRLLIAQAITEGASLISRDEAFSQYPVDVVW